MEQWRQNAMKRNHGTVTASCRFEAFSFGSIRIDGVIYGHDVRIDRGKVRKRKKKPSKKFRETLGHTPVSADEMIPWECKRLVIGNGKGALPVMGRSEKGSHTSPSRFARAADSRGDRGASQEPARHECHPSCDLLMSSCTPTAIRMRLALSGQCSAD